MLIVENFATKWLWMEYAIPKEKDDATLNPGMDYPLITIG
jgi:hypothetical protein